MCGRYVSPDEASIEREFNLVRQEWSFPPSFNVAPTQIVPVLRTVDGLKRGLRLRWGLIPFFARGEPPKYSTINARIETVETAASYRGPWKRGQRCLQVATGFYEWHLNAEGRKAPFYITVVDQPVFAFAALWDRSVKADGTAVESCVHITMPANALMREIHNTGNNPHRMPAILKREDQAVWLNGTAEEARDLLAQYDPGLMLAHEVTTRVNTPKNNDPSLIDVLSTSTGGISMPNEISCPECGVKVQYERTDLNTTTSAKPARCPHGHDFWLQVEADGFVNAHKQPAQ